MFRDFKTGGYSLESCRATEQRFQALVLLVAIAYTLTTDKASALAASKLSITLDECQSRTNRKNDIVIFGSGYTDRDELARWICG